MIIGINASFARKPNTGIGQVTLNFLRKLSEVKCQMSNVKCSFEFILYLEEDVDLELPSNFSKQVFLPLWKRDDLIRKIWWEKHLLPRKVKKDDCDIFISLYQCPTVFKHSPFGKGSTREAGEGFEGHTGRQNFQIPLNPPFLKGEIRHIMLAHDIIPKLFPEYLNNFRKKYYWKLTEKAMRKADKIMAVSTRTEKDLIQHLNIDPAKISVNHIDADEIYKKNVETRHSLSVLKKYKLKPGYIYNGGGLEVRKNTEGVIRAYKYLLDKNNPPAGGRCFIKEFPQLAISGKLMPQLAPLVADVEKLIKELNLTQHVRLLDFVPQEDLPALYANAGMFVYPSFYEGFGLPVLEAMNQGTPVITAKTSSLPEVGGDSVLYCDPNDPRDLMMVMKNVLLNKNLRDTLSKRGKERAKNFSWERFTDKFLNIIENL